MSDNNSTKIPVDAEPTEMKLPRTRPDSTLQPGEIPRRHFGIILWLLIGTLALLLVGFFLWQHALQQQADPTAELNATRPTAAQNREPESTNAVADVAAFTTMSSSDELAAIEADLISTNLDSLATERGAIEAELRRHQ